MAAVMTRAPWRAKLPEAMTQVQQHHVAGREITGRIPCPHCTTPLQFTVDARGRSRGHCLAASCMRWAC